MFYILFVGNSVFQIVGQFRSIQCRRISNARRRISKVSRNFTLDMKSVDAKYAPTISRFSLCWLIFNCFERFWGQIRQKNGVRIKIHRFQVNYDHCSFLVSKTNMCIVTGIKNDSGKIILDVFRTASQTSLVFSILTPNTKHDTKT